MSIARHGTTLLSALLVPFFNLIIVGALAQELSTQPVPPSTTAYALGQAPVIDGNVAGDGAWERVIPATGFSQVRPDEGQPATQRTEVRVGFTEDALYIGLIAFETDPSRIIVTDSRRDAPLDDTDSFRVIIDGMLDRQNGFVFGTNPAGLQFDAQVTNEGSGGGFGGGGGPGFRGGGGGFNLNWDTTWEVEARIHDYGWSAEMEIPFSSLRYGNGDQQTWGINFQRNIRHNNEIAYWAPLDRQFDLSRVSEAGLIEGVRVPSQRALQFTPYVLGSAERGGSIASGTVDQQDIGFDFKYTITPSLVLDGTFNTDFAQVEADELQVNLDRFSLFFPEKRPFFLENAGQFSVGNPREVELFFSRRIGVGAGGTQLPIEGGARLTGKILGNTNVGLLQMRTESVDGRVSQNDFSVARINQELGNRSTVGMMYIERNGDGTALGNPGEDYNRTMSVDGRWGIGDTTLVSGWAARTETPYLQGRDTAGGLQATYQDEDWNINGGYSEVRENFNPEVGFLARRAYRRWSGGWRYRYRPDDWWNLHELRPHMNYRGYWGFDGFQETGYLHVDNHWEFESGMEIHTGMNFTLEGVREPFEIVDGVWVPAGTYEHSEIQPVFWTDQSAPLSVNVRSNIGGFFGGDRVTTDSTVRYQLDERFSTEVSWNRSDISLPVANGDFTVNLARVRVSYSFTPNISLQTLVQYNDRDDVLAANVRFAWLQSANSGLFLVYNEVDEFSGLNMPHYEHENARQFILKYSRIFDFFN